MRSAAIPKVSFGMIVLSGEPFLRYNLRALYPFAHQIIVVEGAAPAAAAIATVDGHSTDGTLEQLRAFRAEEDPEGKLLIVTAEDEGHPDGFWPGEKDEQSQAYAKRATGDYLWQIDVDEFYQPEAMRAILHMLRVDPGITAVSFPVVTFWGGFDYTTDGWYQRHGGGIFHRLFRWGPGYRYVTHRFPTVHDPQGRDLRRVRWLNGAALARKGVRLYHYSLVFPRQVKEKAVYYGRAKWNPWKGTERWAEEAYFKLRRPFRVHIVFKHLSWLDRFRGVHPPQIEKMQEDIRSGRVSIELRPTVDIEELLRSPLYRLGRGCLKLLSLALPRK